MHVTDAWHTFMSLTLQNWVSRVSRIPGEFFEKLGGFPKIQPTRREVAWRANQNLVFCMQYEIGRQRFIFGVGVPCGGLGTYVGGKGLP